MNARDDMSAMSFCRPGMWIGMNDEARRSRMRRWRNRRSAPAATDVVVDPLVSHAIADVLSAKMPICLNSRDGKVSSATSQPNTIPASSRSLIVSEPLSKSARISSHHSCCHTMGGTSCVPDTMTPPAPNLHASVYSMMWGFFGTRRWMGVGWR